MTRTILEGDMARAIRDGWRRWRERRAASHEASACDPVVLEGIAREFGLTVAELRNLAELGPGTTDLLYRRMDELGLDRATIAQVPLARVDLERCCAQCDHKAACAHDLDIDPHGEHWRTYCPNEATLVVLRSGKDHARA